MLELRFVTPKYWWGAGESSVHKKTRKTKKEMKKIGELKMQNKIIEINLHLSVIRTNITGLIN